MPDVNFVLSLDDFNALINYIVTLESAYIMKIDYDAGYIPCDDIVVNKLKYNQLVNLRENLTKQLFY